VVVVAVARQPAKAWPGGKRTPCRRVGGDNLGGLLVPLPRLRRLRAGGREVTPAGSEQRVPAVVEDAP